VLPLMNLKALYGPFYVSVGLLFWAYCSGLILLAGAQMTAIPPVEKEVAEDAGSALTSSQG
jgi:uncharacterized BrkB/YihY/UPF0761 family membrane protein